MEWRTLLIISSGRQSFPNVEESTSWIKFKGSEISTPIPGGTPSFWELTRLTSEGVKWEFIFESPWDESRRATRSSFIWPGNEFWRWVIGWSLKIIFEVCRKTLVSKNLELHMPVQKKAKVNFYNFFLNLLGKGLWLMVWEPIRWWDLDLWCEKFWSGRWLGWIESCGWAWLRERLLWLS